MAVSRPQRCPPCVLAGLWVVFWVCGPSALSAQLGQPVRDELGTYVVSDVPEISLLSLAEAWAPDLWFSDFEQLLLPRAPAAAVEAEPLAEGESGSLPDTLQPRAMTFVNGPPVPDAAVVYYRAWVITPRDGASFAAKWDLETNPTPATQYYEQGCPVATADHPYCLRIDEIGLIRLQYIFYFERDEGANAHTHDMEIAEFWIQVEEATSEENGALQWRLSLDRVYGYAHAQKATANKLRLDRDPPTEPLHLPITLLIERGKHAPAPDRNADGHFTPGFDVNTMVSDAWGVRDVFGSGWYGSAGYSSWMTLPRDSLFIAGYPSEDRITDPRWPYELWHFESSIPAVRDDDDSRLWEFLDHHQYQRPPHDGPDQFFGLYEHFGGGIRFDLGYGPYASVRLIEIPLIGGFPVLTGAAGMNWAGTGIWWGGSLFYSPSIAAFANIYGGVTWMQCPSCAVGKGAGPEAGMKFRIPIPQMPDPKSIGLRVGLRYSSFNPIRNGRLIVEVGFATP
jgi:hypothetical protein